MAKKKPIKTTKLTKPTKRTATTTVEKPLNYAQQQQEENQHGIWQDERFQHLVTDPRFKTLPKAQRKVKIDKRFQGMFTDDKFKVKYTVDKYGRKVNKSNADDLKKFYELETSESSAGGESDEEEERRKEEKAIGLEGEGKLTQAGEESDENDSGEDVPKTVKERLLDPDIDYARGEGRLLTDSSDDDESSDGDDDPELNIDHVWGELDAEAETTEESTRRLAVCNMDWDRIRATDLMMLFSSFLQPGGSVISVKIYPSEFGKERMAEEEAQGPAELVGLGKEVGANKSKKDNAVDDSEEDVVPEQDSDAEEGDDYHMEKLRQYQLNRLKYFYAVVEFDSVRTADKVYKECDGIEYESSATRVDLRYIPDDTSFDDDVPKDICTELPDSNYAPRQFTTTALQQAKVDLTWDETSLERRELGDILSTGKMDGVKDNDLRKILAYSSEEESEDGDDGGEPQEANDNGVADDSKSDSTTEAVKESKKLKPKRVDIIEKYKSLLEEIEENEKKEKEKKYEMEFTWNVNDSKGNSDDDDNDVPEAVKEKPAQQLTPIERAMQKRSEKNKKRKEERKKKKLQAKGIDPDDVNSDSDDDSLPDGIDMNDPYFTEEFANGDFIDPRAKKMEKKKNQKKTVEALEKDAEEEERKAKELQLLLDDDGLEEQGKQHFSLEKILKSEQETKSKRKRRKQLRKSKATIAEERKEVEDNFQMNVNDDRFKSLYTSHLFNIDPTDSHFKKTKGMEKLIQEKQKRRHDNDANGLQSGNGISQGQETAENEASTSKRPRKQLENTLLIKSLKRKIQMKKQ